VGDVTEAASGHPTVRRGSAAVTILRAPWTAQTWLATTHVMVGAPIGLATSGLLVLLGLLTAGLALLPLTWLFTRWQRARFAAYLGVSIQVRPGRGKGEPWGHWLWGEVRAADTWRQVGYHLVAGVLGVFAAIAVLGCWSGGGLALVTVVIQEGFQPAGASPGSTPALVAVTLAGVLLILAAPWVARGAAALDLSIARTLLEHNSREELTHRVQSLAASRVEVVAAADAERRRIERDLHDGAQQRLVSLAMNLGITRAMLADVPAPARQAIENAHEEAKRALSDLRDFVRGLHPVVLDDRGLDAALSGVTARSPVPVRLRVKMDERPSQTIEAIAYFVVSETLANAAKHAKASRVDIVVDQPVPGRLRIAITDDGIGGARVDGGGGTGLRGLAQRATSVDGTFTMDSPPGGPTHIVVALPCES
jgi:signal transduction histidine kinase